MNDVVRIAEKEIHVVSVGAQGPRGADGYVGADGAPGAPGADGVGVDLNFTHNQGTPSATWVVLHNLGKYPSVVVIDSGNTEVVGTYVYDSINQVTLTFNGSFSGTAHLN